MTTLITDAESTLYTIGDLIDMRDMEQGAWFEGKIRRIVYDPKNPYVVADDTENMNVENGGSKPSSDKESDLENKPPEETSSPESKAKKKGIAKYFTKSPKSLKKKQEDDNSKENVKKNIDEYLLYKVQLDSE